MKTRILTIFAAALVLCSCEELLQTMLVESISLDKTEAVLATGESLVLTATTEPMPAEGEKEPIIVWTCEPEGMLTLEQDPDTFYKCKVTANSGCGVATVKATCGLGNNEEKIAACEVVVASNKISLKFADKALAGQSVQVASDPEGEVFKSLAYTIIKYNDTPAESESASVEIEDNVIDTDVLFNYNDVTATLEVSASNYLNAVAKKELTVYNWFLGAQIEGRNTNNGYGTDTELVVNICGYENNTCVLDPSAFDVTPTYNLKNDCNGNVTFELNDEGSPVLSIVRNSVSRHQTLTLEATIGSVTKSFSYLITD